ncbi:MAG TPA: DUF2071 domain-containing protein [Chthoniobacterales bacterium]|nr:DUF2071 domain-containing protein [Chthoniobacterales bacterium]
MTAAAAALLPNKEQRLAVRARPVAPAVMYQQWRDLLFLHWEYPITAIASTLPRSLYVDTFGGKAYLGIVPFFMRNVRPRFLPAVRGISHFMELNLRTYVYDEAGVPGVWFYSLDANQWLAVEVARRLFGLPYEHARMESKLRASGAIEYRSTRRGAAGPTVFEYARGAELPAASPDSLEFFLIERYRLFAVANGRLRRGTVFHRHYPLCTAEVSAWDDHLFALDGFAAPGRAPDHIVMSPGVDVTMFPFQQVST